MEDPGHSLTNPGIKRQSRKSARIPKPKEEPCSYLGWQHLSAPTLQREGGGHGWWGTALLLQVSPWSPGRTAQLSAWPRGRRTASREHDRPWLPISQASTQVVWTKPKPGELSSCSHFHKANTPKTQELLRHNVADT